MYAMYTVGLTNEAVSKRIRQAVLSAFNHRQMFVNLQESCNIPQDMPFDHHPFVNSVPEAPEYYRHFMGHDKMLDGNSVFYENWNESVETKISDIAVEETPQYLVNCIKECDEYARVMMVTVCATKTTIDEIVQAYLDSQKPALDELVVLVGNQTPKTKEWVPQTWIQPQECKDGTCNCDMH